MRSPTTDEALWVFGYGSLMWRPGFAVSERRVGFIHGYARRFWQGSTDHRGVPGAPGRVVTLIAERDAHCWGVAYRVADEDRAEVLAGLDHREKGGYARRWEPVHGERQGGPRLRALLYIATEDNPNYLGPSPLEDMVEQIAGAEGPSGDNVTYVIELERALRAIGAVDAHVYELATALRKRLERL